MQLKVFNIISGNFEDIKDEDKKDEKMDGE